MKYDESLIHITNKFCESDTMYSLVLLEAKSLTLTLSGYRCFLDGKYIVCLNIDDTLSVHGGYYEAEAFRFQPYFYNINLSHDMIGMEFYSEMREKYGYPDFRLFRMRDNSYFGIISISEEEYKTASLYFAKAKRDIESHIDDVMWSCRVRSDIISVLHIAEGAYLGKQSGLENEILRYIHDNINAEISLESLCSRFKTNRTTLSAIIKEKTGLPPMKYVLEIRLNQSRPDLLFTQLPIQEIAEKYGFSNSNYYIRAFKKRFGKSPLQFRKQGWEERIRDEGIYQRRAEREKRNMTVAEFGEYYKKGLGRAIIYLKEQKDKEQYKALFKKMVLNANEYKLWRPLDIYEKDILDVFDDKDFTESLAEQLLNIIYDKKENYTAIPLLNLLGCREQTTRFLEKQYRESYTLMLEYTKKPWDGEKYPYFATDYMKVAGALSRFAKVGDERIKEILFDIADLYDHTDSPVVPAYQNPLFQILDGVGKEHFFLILDEVIMEHKNGYKIDIRNQIVFDPDKKFPEVTVSDILSVNELSRENLYFLDGFAKLDEESKKAVAQAALDETDIEKKIYLLHYFVVPIGRPGNRPPVFPLDVEPLIKAAEKEGFRLPDNPPFGLTYIVLQILENKKCDSARKLAMRFYSDNSISDELHQYAARIRFGKNYCQKEDASDFVAMLRSPNDKERQNAIDIFISDIGHGIEGLPLEMIPYVFKTLTDSLNRFRFCDLLAEKGIMPDELKEECIYDCVRHTRELFLKIQTPKKAKAHVFLSAPE